MSRKSMFKLADDIEKMANDHNIYVELYDVGDDYVSFEIDWGDWKHDHARFDYLVGVNFQPFSYVETLLEEDGSDAYSSVHKFYFETAD